MVMFLYRDDYYNKDTEHPNEAEVIIAKQRNGPIGTVTLIWKPEYTKFVNAVRPQGGKSGRIMYMIWHLYQLMQVPFIFLVIIVILNAYIDNKQRQKGCS